MSGEDGQTPSASQQIDQTVQQDQLQQILQAVSPIAGLVYGTGNVVERAQAGGGGGGYEFSPAQIDAAIGKFQDVVAKSVAVQQQLSSANLAMNLAPAGDGPSSRQSAAVMKSLGEAGRHNQMLRDYAQQYLQKLHAAKAQYQEAERTNAGNAQRQM